MGDWVLHCGQKELNEIRRPPQPGSTKRVELLPFYWFWTMILHTFGVQVRLDHRPEASKAGSRKPNPEFVDLNSLNSKSV